MTNSIDFYQLEAKSIDGKIISMADYKGKWLLIVNTASECGFTPQLAGLEALREKYHAFPFEVLGFPCNQFGNQEPGDESSILQGCVANYGIQFPMFAKIKVNGPDAHPIFRYLKTAQRGLVSSIIKWNFTKFLVDPTGKPIKRWAPTVSPEVIDKSLNKLFNGEGYR
mgnify:CR=1 FL=1